MVRARAFALWTAAGLLAACASTNESDNPCDPTSGAFSACSADASGPGPQDGSPRRNDQFAPRIDTDFNDPCDGNETCTSGYCVQKESGDRVCTRLCGVDADCPGEWACLQVVNAGVDTTYICTPPQTDPECVGVDFARSPDHCGACKVPCRDYANAERLCVDSRCVMGDCRPGWRNINGAADDGCEYGCFPSNDGVETCDDQDNDCDGVTDEGFELDTDVENCGRCGRSCALPNAAAVACRAGACEIGRCLDGFFDRDGETANGCENGGMPGADDDCDGIDDDSDGDVDEDFEPARATCGVGRCAAEGVTACADGNPTHDCVPAAPALDDANCNGIDDDCNGQIDDGYLPTDACGEGICAVGAEPSSCVAGRETPCRPGPALAADDATCDGMDDDCDGRIDEDYLARSCGVGACAAEAIPSRCVDGVQTDCSPGEMAELAAHG
mgnify:CR=1 FL=1